MKAIHKLQQRRFKLFFKITLYPAGEGSRGFETKRDVKKTIFKIGVSLDQEKTIFKVVPTARRRAGKQPKVPL
jgi:hypothetical protein